MPPTPTRAATANFESGCLMLHLLVLCRSKTGRALSRTLRAFATSARRRSSASGPARKDIFLTIRSILSAGFILKSPIQNGPQSLDAMSIPAAHGGERHLLKPRDLPELQLPVQ